MIHIHTSEFNHSLNLFIVLSKNLFNNNTKLLSGKTALGLHDALAGNLLYPLFLFCGNISKRKTV